MLSFLCPLHDIPDRRMGSRNREAFKVLLPVNEQSSFDSICSSTVQLIGRGWNYRSRKYLGDHWWSPSLFRHDNRGLATSGETFRLHTTNKRQNWAWNPGPPALSFVRTTEGPLAFLLWETEPLLLKWWYLAISAFASSLWKGFWVYWRSPGLARKCTCEMNTGQKKVGHILNVPACPKILEAVEF